MKAQTQGKLLLASVGAVGLSIGISQHILLNQSGSLPSPTSYAPFSQIIPVSYKGSCANQLDYSNPWLNKRDGEEKWIEESVQPTDITDLITKKIFDLPDLFSPSSGDSKSHFKGDYNCIQTLGWYGPPALREDRYQP